MTATITSKGQITIPKAIRDRLNLKDGDQVEFDEEAPMLVARRVVDRAAWKNALQDWRKASTQALKGHPWEKSSVAEMIDDLRGGKVEKAKR